MIPVFEPSIDQTDYDHVLNALKAGEISGTFGKYLPEFEQKFAEYHDCKYACAVSSGTTALELAVAAFEFEPGSEVLVSASTNIATALAATHNNLVPIPVDSEKETWNLDLKKIEELITPKTVAIIPVHLFGHPVEMNELKALCDKHGIKIIEDCAEAHGATVSGKKVGSFGDFGCFSFYANKIITTGEGGMIVSNDKALIDRVNYLKNLAFGKPRFKHEHRGYNFRMTGYQAAMGVAQLAKIDHFIERKKWLAQAYNEQLSSLSGVNTPVQLEWASNVYWMYAITIDEAKFGMSRDDLMVYLKDNGVDTRTFFCPMNAQPCFDGLRTTEIECPVAEEIWETGLYLPSSVDLTQEEVTTITDLIAKAHA